MTAIRWHRTVYGIVKGQRALSILVLLAIAAVLRTRAQSVAGPSIEYRNKKFGFCFSLPASWKGYLIVVSQWGGVEPPGSQNVVKGPLLRVRHPGWTEQDPYEDIPIMVFTQKQWQLVKGDKLDASGAAPFPPSELGHNARYVFALPPRFDYDFLAGYQEVESLIRQKSLHTPCGMHASGQ